MRLKTESSGNGGSKLEGWTDYRKDLPDAGNHYVSAHRFVAKVAMVHEWEV